MSHRPCHISDAFCRSLPDTFEGNIIGIHGKTEIRKSVFDFGAFVELPSTIDDIGNLIPGQLFFNRTGKIVGTIKNSPILKRNVFFPMQTDPLLTDGIGFLDIIGVAMIRDFVAFLLASCNKVFLPSVTVVINERIRSIQDILSRTIVLVENNSL